MSSVRPFSIEVPDEVLADLARRLAATRWPDPLPGGGWRRGADLACLQRLCAHWQTGYDWRHHEARLNQWPQFITEIDGVDIHFWHIRARERSALPLLLIHGWPGSLSELMALIGPLTDPATYGRAGPAFDLVIPALPGFGFGGKPSDGGWGVSRIGAAFDTLMRERLGYSLYGIHGGDWGTIIGARMAGERPEAVRGLHVTMAYTLPQPGDEPDPGTSAFVESGTAYITLQCTRPDSIALAMADSPAGLANWFLDKFAAWSAGHGDVLSYFSMDDLITNLMFYWAPNSAASAARIYMEMAEEGIAPFGSPPVMVPTAFALFPNEPFRVPRAWLDRIYRIVRWTEFDRGGHFPGLELPIELADDIRSFFGSVLIGAFDGCAV